MKIIMGTDLSLNHGVRGQQVRISVSHKGPTPTVRIAFSRAAINRLDLRLGGYVQAGANESGQLCLRAVERDAFGARKVGGYRTKLHVKFNAEMLGRKAAARYRDYFFGAIEHKGQNVLVVPQFLVSLDETAGEF